MDHNSVVLFEDYLRTSLDLTANSPVQFRESTKLQVSDGKWQSTGTREPDFESTVESLRSSLSRTPAVQTLHDYINTRQRLKDAILSYYHNPSLGQVTLQHALLEGILLPLTSKYLESTQSYEFRRDVFENLISSLEKILFSPSGEDFSWLVSFRNFKSISNDIDLGGGIYLRPATLTEQKAAIEFSYFYSGLRWDARRWRTGYLHAPIDFDIVPFVVLEIEGEMSDIDDSINFIRPFTIAQKFLLAARLSHDAWISLHSCWLRAKNPFFNIHSARQPFPGSEAIALSYDGFSADRLVLDKIKFIWDHLSPLMNGSPKVSLAVKRLMLTYERKSYDDKLIDYWIALEALFSPAKDELALRISLNAAEFLGSDGRDRKAIYTDLKASYDTRSKVVHGSYTKPQPELQKTVDQTGALLRRSLQKVADTGSAPDLNSLLERILLRN